MSKKEKELQKVQDAFITLHKRAKALGISTSQLQNVKAMRSHGSERSRCLFIASIIFGVIAILSGSAFLLYQKGIVTHEGVYKFLAEYVLDFSMEEDTCLFAIPELVLDMFRPPVDCEVCKGISGVDRVSNLSTQTFVEKYAYTSRPVVIVDGTKDWTAPDNFNFEYFKKIYSPDSPVLKSVKEQCQFFPYKTNFATLGDVFNMSDKDANMQGKPWYIGW